MGMAWRMPDAGQRLRMVLVIVVPPWRAVSVAVRQRRDGSLSVAAYRRFVTVACLVVVRTRPSIRAVSVRRTRPSAFAAVVPRMRIVRRSLATVAVPTASLPRSGVPGVGGGGSVGAGPASVIDQCAARCGSWLPAASESETLAAYVPGPSG